MQCSHTVKVDYGTGQRVCGDVEKMTYHTQQNVPGKQLSLLVKSYMNERRPNGSSLHFCTGLGTLVFCEAHQFWLQGNCTNMRMSSHAGFSDTQ